MLRCERAAGTLVEAHGPVAGRGVIVDEHEREAASTQPGHGFRLGVARADKRAVDGQVARGEMAPGCGRRDEGDRHAGGREGGGDRTEERRRDGVEEGVLHRVGEDDAHGAHGSARERSRRGIGAQVAQAARRLEDALAQGGGQLVGAREGVRDRHAAHAHLVGDGLQRHASHGGGLLQRARCRHGRAGVSRTHHRIGRWGAVHVAPEEALRIASRRHAVHVSPLAAQPEAARTE